MAALCCDNDDVARHLGRLRRREQGPGTAPLADGDALHRVCGFLADLLARQRVSEEGCRFLALPMSREDIGNHLDMSAATVTRMLARLRDAGSLAVRPGGIEVLDEVTFPAAFYSSSPGSKPSRSCMS